MRKRLIFVSLGLLPLPAFTQSAGDLYRVTEAVSRNHMEYPQVRVPKGAEQVLAKARAVASTDGPPAPGDRSPHR
jgi:hypothetical protein